MKISAADHIRSLNRYHISNSGDELADCAFFLGSGCHTVMMAFVAGHQDTLVSRIRRMEPELVFWGSRSWYGELWEWCFSQKQYRDCQTQSLHASSRKRYQIEFGQRMYGVSDDLMCYPPLQFN